MRTAPGLLPCAERFVCGIDNHDPHDAERDRQQRTSSNDRARIKHDKIRMGPNTQFLMAIHVPLFAAASPRFRFVPLKNV